MEGLALTEARLAQEKARGLWPGHVVTDYLDQWVEQKPDATALVAWRTEDEAETRLTWRQLARRAAAAARALADAGVRPGDVVSFQLPNWWEFVALYLATVRLGAVANPLMPIFRRRELAFMLRLAGSRVFIAPERFRGFDHGALARELAAELPGMRLVGLDFGSPREEFLRGARLQPDDVTQLLYTSGTTGESKGVLHTSNTLLSAVTAFPPHLRLGADDVIFMPSPLAHQLGFMYGMLMSLMLGIPIVLIDVWRAARAAQLIAAHGATFAYAATPFLADLAEGDAKLPSLRIFASAGAPIPRRWCRPRASGSASPWRPPGA
jgi:cyclohexanecarboxylate-CoA ligase